MGATADPVLIHPTAVVDPSARLGPGTKVWAHAYILQDAVIGAECRIGHAAFIDRGVRVGDRVVIHNKVSLYRPLVVEDDVFIGPHVVFANDPDPRADLTRDLDGLAWTVRTGATVGAGVTVLSDIELAAHCFIGAGAVVTKPTTAFGLYAGVPARLIGYRCTCRARYPVDGLPGQCEQCHRTF